MTEDDTIEDDVSPPSPGRSIELEIEVPGTPEEIWAAIATGPGITSWYVPHQVEEREGGAASARFGPGPDMEIPCRVATWDPPRRVVFDGGEDGEGGLAYEWVVEARASGACVVRLVNSGFGSGDDWDTQYDAMTAGWGMFLLNLRLHLEHFRGRAATAAVPTTMWATDTEEGWRILTEALDIKPDIGVGDRVDVRRSRAPSLGGRVVDAQPWRLSLLVDEPAPGTGIIAVESIGDEVAVSVWSYLYGADGASAAERDELRWQTLLDELAPGAA